MSYIVLEGTAYYGGLFLAPATDFILLQRHIRAFFGGDMLGKLLYLVAILFVTKLKKIPHTGDTETLDRCG